MRQRTKALAVASLSAALATVFLSFGSFIPFATYAAPILALMALIPAVCDSGTAMALTSYVAAALLSLFLAAEKECALVFLFLGYYPALRPHIERLRPKLLQLAVKLLIGLVPMVLLYFLLISLFHMEAIAEELFGDGYVLFALMVLLWILSWLCCDVLIGRLTLLWQRRKKT